MILYCSLSRSGGLSFIMPTSEYLYVEALTHSAYGSVNSGEEKTDKWEKQPGGQKKCEMLVWGHCVHQLKEAGWTAWGLYKIKPVKFLEWIGKGSWGPSLTTKDLTGNWQLLRKGHYPLRMWLFVRCLCSSGWSYTNVPMGRLNDLRFINSGGKAWGKEGDREEGTKEGAGR